MSDLIERQKVIDAAKDADVCVFYSDNQSIDDVLDYTIRATKKSVIASIEQLPSTQPTLCGYDIEHLILIANVLKKENLPPERVVEALTDIGRIVSIVTDEFEESLRKAVEQCKI